MKSLQLNGNKDEPKSVGTIQHGTENVMTCNYNTF